uniref:Uncharacterized protein n=1 Tax=Lepeophtheirus salmonis TaxID=72036 RepID=A0A0K2UE03_LEPSM
MMSHISFSMKIIAGTSQFKICMFLGTKIIFKGSTSSSSVNSVFFISGAAIAMMPKT